MAGRVWWYIMILIAADSFKGSLSSMEAGRSIEKGIKRVYKNARTLVLSLADGGEGTVEAAASGNNGKICKVNVTGPLGRKVVCEYAVINGDTAVIEMAGAAGITLLDKNERNPFYTTTYGVGEVIKDAVNAGLRKFIIGIGGSATNDGGAGMLQALGFRLEGNNGKQIGYGAAGLKDLAVITDETAIPELKECIFKVACDVTNPLCGINGCSMVFGPQKGASQDMAAQMDKWLKNYSVLAKNVNPAADGSIKGSGAGGGIGFAFMAFLNASLEPGANLILNATGFMEYVKKASLVITGEGCLDGQTVMGKAPARAAAIAKKYNKPVIAFAGSVTDKAVLCNNTGIDAFFPVLRSVCTLEEAMDKKRAEKNIEDTVEQVFRLIQVANVFSIDFNN